MAPSTTRSKKAMAGRAVLLGGKYLTMPQAEADKLESLGADFAYLVWHEATGQIMTIPVDARAQ
jgi:hypothetical protein